MRARHENDFHAAVSGGEGCRLDCLSIVLAAVLVLAAVTVAIVTAVIA